MSKRRKISGIAANENNTGTIASLTSADAFGKDPKNADHFQQLTYSPVNATCNHFQQLPYLYSPATTVLFDTDTLSLILHHTDISDINNVALTCKKFSSVLRLISHDHWLALIRRYHPIIERLPTVCTNNISWKELFRRRVSLLASRDSSRATDVQRVPEPKPLESYVFQIDLTLRRGSENIGRTLSTIATPVLFSGTIELVFEDDVARKLAVAESFSSFAISVIVVDRASGKQTLIYHGQPEQLWERDWYYYSASSLSHCTIPIIAQAYAFGVLKKSGCLCTCDIEDDSSSFFRGQMQEVGLARSSNSARRPCHCCSCKLSRECHNSYIFDLSFAFEDQDLPAPDENWVLHLLQYGLVE